jgi:hypothetical protein
VQQALSVAEIPGDELQQVVRPPLPQVQLFPPRFGYPTGTIGITDVMSADRYPPDRAGWSSGEAGSYSGSSRNTLGDGV